LLPSESQNSRARARESFLDAGVLALHDGKLERAGRLLACAHRIFEDTDAIPDPDDRVELDEAVARLEQQLGHRFDSIRAEGRVLSPDEAQALALDDSEASRAGQ
jgi:hypothetical protein